MHLVLEPNVGADLLKFGTERKKVQNLLQDKPVKKSFEPENDFYENKGLILGYDDDDRLEFIEITQPSTAEFEGINFFSLAPKDCINEMKKKGYSAPFDDGGYNFDSVGVALYCPQDQLESVSIYKKGYYEDL